MATAVVVATPEQARALFRVLHPLHGWGTLGALGEAFDARFRGCRLRALSALRAGFLASLGRRELPRNERRAWRLAVVFLMLHAYRGHTAAANPFLPFVLAAAFMDQTDRHGDRRFDLDNLESDDDSDDSDYREYSAEPVPERRSAEEKAAEREARRREKEREEQERQEKQEREKTVADDRDTKFEHAARLLIYAYYSDGGRDGGSDGRDNCGGAARRRRAVMPAAVAHVQIDDDMEAALGAAVRFESLPRGAASGHPVEDLASLMDMLESGGPEWHAFRRAVDSERDEMKYFLRHRYRHALDALEDDEMDEGEDEDDFELDGVSERIVRDVLLSPGYHIRGWLFHEERRTKKMERQVARALSDAVSGPLMPSTQQFVAEKLLARHSLLAQSALLEASTFAELVEHNPTIATAALIAYQGLEASGASGTSVDGFATMLQALVHNRSASLHSMEVVNLVFVSSSPPALSTHFLGAYTVAIIESTAAIGDAYLRHRFVRLICVFLNSVVRHAAASTVGGVPNSDDGDGSAAATVFAAVFGEGESAAEALGVVTSFCIEHSNVREATDLFRVFAAL